MTRCPQNAPNCTDLHLHFQNFPGGNSPESPKLANWGGVKPPHPDSISPSMSAHRPTFSELPRPLLTIYYEHAAHYIISRKKTKLFNLDCNYPLGMANAGTRVTSSPVLFQTVAQKCRGSVLFQQKLTVNRAVGVSHRI